MSKYDNLYQSVKIIIDDKLTDSGKSQAFINAVISKYLDIIVEAVDDAINNELEYLIEHSSISNL